MPRLSRIYQKIFGSSAGATEIGQFGSLAAGSPTTTTNPTTMQALGAFDGGWFDAVLGGNSPAIEDMNAVHYLAFYQLAYMMENGIPQYDSTTEYYQGSVVQYNNQYYKCLVDNTIGVTPAIGASWQYMTDAAFGKASNSGHVIATGTTIQSQLDSLDTAISTNGRIVKDFSLFGSFAGTTFPLTNIDVFPIPTNCKVLNTIAYFGTIGSGTTEIDIEYAATPAGTFNSIFTTLPKVINTAANERYVDSAGLYAATTGVTAPVLNTSISNSLAAGGVLRFDLSQGSATGAKAKIVVILGPV